MYTVNTFWKIKCMFFGWLLPFPLFPLCNFKQGPHSCKRQLIFWSTLHLPKSACIFLIWSCVNLFASMPVFDNIPSNDVICAVTFSAATWAVVFFLVPDVDGHSLVVS